MVENPKTRTSRIILKYKLKAYKKPFTMLVEEGTYISKGELLNSKSEWHQAKIIRTTTQVIQGGADLLQGHVGRRGGLWGAGHDEGGSRVVRDQPREVRQGKNLEPVQQPFSFQPFPFPTCMSDCTFLFGTEIAIILSTKNVYQ